MNNDSPYDEEKCDLALSFIQQEIDEIIKCKVEKPTIYKEAWNILEEFGAKGVTCTIVRVSLDLCLPS